MELERGEENGNPGASSTGATWREEGFLPKVIGIACYMIVWIWDKKEGGA